jgi:ABC-type histidine transport system ATPase subunit
MLLLFQDAASARIGQGASTRPGRRARRRRAHGQPPGAGDRNRRQDMPRAGEAPSQRRVALRHGGGYRARFSVASVAPRPMNAHVPVLAVEEIYKRFGAVEVLAGVSLLAREHEVVSILGRSGSGKSTLLRCINLLEIPDAGRVSVRGELIRMREGAGGRRPCDARQVQRIRARLGMVFQQFNLWSHMSVEQNVAEAPMRVLGLSRPQAHARARRLLDRVGLHDRRDYYPAHLSGGQQQRAAIARALAMEPDLMLFDEPTSALDPELVGEVLKVMRALAEEGRTMLVVTHELAFAREVSSRVVFLHQGRVEEQGDPGEVLERPRSERVRRFLSGMTGASSARWPA